MHYLQFMRFPPSALLLKKLFIAMQNHEATKENHERLTQEYQSLSSKQSMTKKEKGEIQDGPASTCFLQSHIKTLAETLQKLSEQIKADENYIEHLYNRWKISLEAIPCIEYISNFTDLIYAMLQSNPQHRITAAQALHVAKELLYKSNI